MIFAYRNVDSPNGDFGLDKREGDEEFVVLTKAEAEFYKAALAYCPTAEWDFEFQPDVDLYSAWTRLPPSAREVPS